MKRIEVRSRILRPGDVVSVRHCQAVYRLPEGLAEATPVTVVRLHIGYAGVVDGNGHPWQVAFTNIEMPESIWWNGRWIDRRTHPEGEQAYAAFMAQSQASDVALFSI